MLNKRFKAGIQKALRPEGHFKLTAGVLAVSAACLFLVITAGFTVVKPDFAFQNTDLETFLNIDYIPQIPAVIFTAALLGRALSMLVMLAYAALGLSLAAPVFAFGGGPDYVFQYTFGYTASFIFAAYFCAKELRNGSSFIHTITAVLTGVFIIHISGIIYTVLIAFIRQDTLEYTYSLIFYQSLSKILYDILLSIAAAIAAKPVKKLLFLVV